MNDLPRTAASEDVDASSPPHDWSGNLEPHDHHVLGSVQLYAVYWDPELAASPDLSGGLDAALSEAATGHYFDGLAQYGVHNGQWCGSTVIAEPVPAELRKADIVGRLKGWLDDGTLPIKPAASDKSLLHLVVVPSGTLFPDQPSAAGYHWFDSYHSDSKNLFWGVIRRSSASVDRTTDILTHELVEACTDRDLKGWKTPQVNGSRYEICDVCEGNRFPFPVYSGRHRVEPYWSNHDQRCIAGHLAWESLTKHSRHPSPQDGLVSTAACATSWGPGRLDLFALDPDGHVGHRWYEAGWGDWETLDSPVLAEAPVAVCPADHVIELFGRGRDDVLYHGRYDGGFQEWLPLGADDTQGLAVTAWGPDRLDLFARGGGGVLLRRSNAGRDTPFSDWQQLGGELTMGPAAVAWAPGRIDVFGVGPDSQLQHHWDGGDGGGWEELGGSHTSAPAVASWAEGRLDVFTRGENAGMWHLWYEDGWGHWEAISVGDQFDSEPGATSWERGRIDIVGRMGDALLHKYYEGDWYP